MKESQGRAPIEDAILVSNVLKGDVDSFQVIVEKYQLNILRFIYGRILLKRYL